jgi:hypothetical protein
VELEDIKFAIIDDWRRKPHSSIEGHRNKHISVPVYAIDGTRVPNTAVSPDITVPPPWKTFTPPAQRAPGRNPKPFTFGHARRKTRVATRGSKSKDNKHSSLAEIELPLPAAYVEKPLNWVEREFGRGPS